MTSTFTPNIYLEQPGVGDYADDWNVPVNSDWSVIDQTFGSSTSVAFTNANVTLTVAQSAYFQITCTGTLTANVKLILPATIGGRRLILNQCAGAYTLTVLNGSSDTGGGVVVGQGFLTPVVLTAGRAYYDAYGATPPGTLLPFAGASAPPGFLLCYGQTVSQTTYAQLYTALGTTWGPASGGNFTLPDFRGIVLAGADNMGGSAAGRLTGYSIGTTGGDQSQSFSVAQANLPNVNFTVSGITLNDPGHTHTIPESENPTGGSGGASSTTQQVATLTSSNSKTGITITSQGQAASGGSGTAISISDVQPTAAINYMIRY